jgi:hypothetical protein
VGLGLAAVQNTLELWQQGFFKNTKNVIEMGSQELHFFEGLAAANNYKIIHSSYVIATKADTTNGSGLSFHVPMSRELLQTMDLTKIREVNVYGVLQKQTEADFEYPYQDHYSLKKQEHFAFNRLFFRDPPSYSFIPVGMEQPTQLVVKMLVQRIINKVRSKLTLLKLFR